MQQSNVLLIGGVGLIALGIFSAFQVTGVWVLLLLLIFGGAGLFLVMWGGTRQSHRPPRRR